MVQLSIIIPAMGGPQALEDTLVSVLSNRPDDCEIMVVCPEPYDDPYDLRDEVRFIETDGKPTLIGLANAGIEASKGRVIHLLGVGIEVVEGWTQLPMRWLQCDRSVGAVSPLIVAADDRRRAIAAGVRYRGGGRRTVTGKGDRIPETGSYWGQVDGPTIRAGFYRRSAMVSAHGFDPLVGDQLADVDLAIRLRKLGYRCVFEPGCALTGLADMFHDARRGFHQGRLTERLFWRHLEREGRAHSLLLHSIEIMVDGLSQLPRLSAVTDLAGRVVTMWEVVRGRQPRSLAAVDRISDRSASSDCGWEIDRANLREAG